MKLASVESISDEMEGQYLERGIPLNCQRFLVMALSSALLTFGVWQI